MKKDNKDTLDELYKGSCMGRDAVSFVLDNVTNGLLKKELEQLKERYLTFLNKIDEIYPLYADKKPHETNEMNKMMTWYSIQMKTMKDHSNSRLAELIMQGINMGIIEGTKILNHKVLDEEVKNIAQEYVDIQEEILPELKKYL